PGTRAGLARHHLDFFHLDRLARDQHRRPALLSRLVEQRDVVPDELVELGEVVVQRSAQLLEPRRDHVAGRLGVRQAEPEAERLQAIVETIEVVDVVLRSEEHTSELQSLAYLVCRLLLEKKKQPQM